MTVYLINFSLFHLYMKLLKLLLLNNNNNNPFGTAGAVPINSLNRYRTMN